MRKSILLALLLALVPACQAQQPQSQTAPISALNAKYVNGVAPGYYPTAGSGLTLNVGAGTAFCSGSVVTYAGGTLTMTASATNYVYLDTASSCAPAVKTTAFTTSDVPVAEVVAGASAITSISDVRTPFSAGSAGGAGSATFITADGTGSPPANYQVLTAGANITLTPNPSAHTMTIADSGGASSTYAYDPVSSIHYGDSITNQSSCNSHGVNQFCYPNRIDNAFNIPASAVHNYSIGGDMACDVAPLQILVNDIPTIAQQEPLRTLLIGSNDAPNKVAATYEPTFNACYLGVLSYLTVPSQNKVTGGSVFSGAHYTGTCASDTTYSDATGIDCTANGSTATFTITTTGGPIYIWPRAIDSDTGTWTYSVDGGTAVAETTALNPSISTINGGTQSMAFIRVTGLSAGSHTVVFTMTSSTGNMAILAVGTPANSYFADLPYLVVGDTPYQLNGNQTSLITPYVGFEHTDISLLQGDGLNISLAPVNSFLLATTAANDMYDNIHPNAEGMGEVAAAFEVPLKVLTGVPQTDLTNAVNLPLTTGVTGVLPVANGGTGTTTPSLVAGTGISVTGTWPNQTITNTGSGGSGSGGGTSGWSGAPTTSLATTATQYIPWVGGGAMGATEANVELKAPIAANISGLQVFISASLGTGTTFSVTLRDAGVSTALTCTSASAGTTCSDLTHTVAVAQNDLVDFQIVASGTVTAGTPNIIIGYSTSTSAGFTGYVTPNVVATTFVAFQSSSTTVLTTPSYTPTLGDEVLVLCRGNYAETETVTSSPAETWTALPAGSYSGGQSMQGARTVISTSGAHTFTCTASTAGTYRSVMVLEIAGTTGFINAAGGFSASTATWRFDSGIAPSARSYSIFCTTVDSNAGSYTPGLLGGPTATMQVTNSPGGYPGATTPDSMCETGVSTHSISDVIGYATYSTAQNWAGIIVSFSY